MQMCYSLSVPATSRERRDSTNGRIADCANVLLNIDENSVSRRATTLVARASIEAMNMQMCYFLVRSGHESRASRLYEQP
ncbi:MAG: hypothetical protein IJE18_02230 [Bacteroidaceae bacterium]|nr:hypothetical protein [Bacteroidaceae bacterium]